MAGALALAALGSVAVLGVGAPTAEAAPNVSPFAGSWSGPWDIDELPDHYGTFDWTISDEGQITGTVHYTDTRTGSVVGHVGDDGRLSFIGFVDPGAGAAPFKGTAVIDADGKLAIVAAGMFNGAPYNHDEDWLLASLERN